MALFPRLILRSDAKHRISKNAPEGDGALRALDVLRDAPPLAALFRTRQSQVVSLTG